jgi:hypothetical protein
MDESPPLTVKRPALPAEAGDCCRSVEVDKMANKLARKRARDRRAQQAMRDRAKTEIECLRAEVAQLSARLEGQHAIKDTSMPADAAALSLLQAQVGSVPRAIHVLPRMHHESDFGVAFDPLILDEWYASSASADTVTAARSPSTSIDRTSSFMQSVLGPSSTSVSSDPFGCPWHIPPSCAADRIIQPFIEEKRRLVEFLGLNSASTAGGTMSTGGGAGLVANLGEYSPATHVAAIKASIAKVVRDLIGTYLDIQTLPNRVACLYILSWVLNVRACAAVAQPIRSVCRHH